MSIEVLPPLFAITDNDKRGLVVVVTATTLSFIWACLLTRIWLRFKSREWKLDDYFLTAATVLGTVQSGLVLDLTCDGLGMSIESLSDAELQHIGKDDFGAQILYIFTLLLTKSAVLFLYLRLSPRREDRIASWTTLGVSTVWALLSTFLIMTPCNPVDFWVGGPVQCPEIYTKWQTIGAIDIITEAAIFLLSVYLVARLQMRTTLKITAIAAFSARLPLIAVAAIRLAYLRGTFSSSDRTLSGSYYVVCTQVELSYAIMSCSMTAVGPFLRPFSNSFSTSYRRSSYSQDPSILELSQGSRNFTRTTESLGQTYQLPPLKAQTLSGVSFNGSSRHGHGDHDGRTPPPTPLKAQTLSGVSFHGSSRHGHEDHDGRTPPPTPPPTPFEDEIPALYELNLRPDMDPDKRNAVVYKRNCLGDEEGDMGRLSDDSLQTFIKKTTRMKGGSELVWYRGRNGSRSA